MPQSFSSLSVNHSQVKYYYTQKYTYALLESVTYEELLELSGCKLFNDSVRHVHILNSCPENSQAEIPLSQNDFEQIIMAFGEAPLKFQLILFYILCRSGQSVTSKILKCWMEQFIAQAGFQNFIPELNY